MSSYNLKKSFVANQNLYLTKKICLGGVLNEWLLTSTEPQNRNPKITQITKLFKKGTIISFSSISFTVGTPSSDPDNLSHIRVKIIGSVKIKTDAFLFGTTGKTVMADMTELFAKELSDPKIWYDSERKIIKPLTLDLVSQFVSDFLIETSSVVEDKF